MQMQFTVKKRVAGSQKPNFGIKIGEPGIEGPNS
jgi:hypothetical protein